MLCFTLYLRAIFQVQALGGAYIWRGDLTEGFLRYRFGGLVFEGAYKWRDLFSEFYGMSVSMPPNLMPKMHRWHSAGRVDFSLYLDEL